MGMTVTTSIAAVWDDLDDILASSCGTGQVGRSLVLGDS